MKQSERSSKFVWFLLVIVVPSIFAVTIFAIVLSFMGVNVLDAAKDVGKNIPIIKNAFKEDSVPATVTNADAEKHWQSKFDEQEDYIKILNADLQKKENEVSDLKSDVALLEKQVEEVEKTKKDEKSDQLKKLYESMSAKDAAAVLTEMKDADVLQILALLQPEAQAGILAKLDPKRAAQLTEQMTSESL
jgi:flagellar motility protein MotE (MotC chaperone)